MQLDQLCFYAANETQGSQIAASLGLLHEPWITDHMKGETMLWRLDRNEPEEVETEATLQFCYSHGPEIEILTFTKGKNYAESIGLRSQMESKFCHLGFHLEEGEDFPQPGPNNAYGLYLVQRTVTTEHTNPHLVDLGRKYEYRIFWSLHTGVFYKYIRRLEG